MEDEPSLRSLSLSLSLSPSLSSSSLFSPLLFILPTCRCTGNEEYLMDCDKYTRSRAQSCGHQGDVSVTCNVPRICGEVKVIKINNH